MDNKILRNVLVVVAVVIIAIAANYFMGKDRSEEVRQASTSQMSMENTEMGMDMGHSGMFDPWLAGIRETAQVEIVENDEYSGTWKVYRVSDFGFKEMLPKQIAEQGYKEGSINVYDVSEYGFNEMIPSTVIEKDNYSGEIAAIIIEPVAGNMGVIPPTSGFLQGLRSICDLEGIILIFDEVMTGFRVAKGGAQELFHVVPDLTTLGKIIGGGMPVGAFGGRADIMAHLAPEGGVYQAGTLSGNPVAMAAGLATLERLDDSAFYHQIESKTQNLVEGILSAAKSSGVAMSANRVGAMFGLFFTERQAVTNFSDVMSCDGEKFNRFFHGMLDKGVYLAPSAFEAGFVSAAHSDEDIDATIGIAADVLGSL